MSCSTATSSFPATVLSLPEATLPNSSIWTLQPGLRSWKRSVAVAAALHRAFNPTKINYELLGNMVPHMHWHVVPRFTTDPLWPRPIWSEPHAAG